MDIHKTVSIYINNSQYEFKPINKCLPILSLFTLAFVFMITNYCAVSMYMNTSSINC